MLENPSYEGLTHRRTIFMVDDKFYVILARRVLGTAAGTVNRTSTSPRGRLAGGVRPGKRRAVSTRVLRRQQPAGAHPGKQGGAFVKKRASNALQHPPEPRSAKAYQLNLEKDGRRTRRCVTPTVLLPHVRTLRPRTGRHHVGRLVGPERRRFGPRAKVGGVSILRCPNSVTLKPTQ